MSWLNDFWQHLAGRDGDFARRSHREESLSLIETLEARLCLGGMATPDLSDWSSGSPLPPLDFPTDTAAEVETLELPTIPPPSFADAELRNGAAFDSSGSPQATHRLTGAADQSPQTPRAPLGTGLLGGHALHAPRPVLAAQPPAESPAMLAVSDAAHRATNGGSAASAFAAADASAPSASPGASSPGSSSPAGGNEQITQGRLPWWTTLPEPVVVRYDFRDIGGYQNAITPEQRDRAVDALEAWTDATDGRVVFVQDAAADTSEILNIGTGDLAAFGHVSGTAGTLGMGGGSVQLVQSGEARVTGTAWLDAAETWDVQMGNGDPEGTFDYFTAVAHEVGHVLGYEDSNGKAAADIMDGVYGRERSADAVTLAVLQGTLSATLQPGVAPPDHVAMHPLVAGSPQLAGSEVEQLLDRAAAASASEDAIIAVVDRGGNILGVRVESGALAAIPDEQTLVFAIDGAVAKARTAAFFANGDPANGTLAPITSRLVQFISQSTVTQREVESNPNVGLDAPADTRTAAEVYASTVYGPGFVAPIGVGGKFPPGIPFVTPVDLFAIEHTNRDSLIHPGEDHIKGTADDQVLPYRFNVTPAFVPSGQEISAPESYGFVSGRLINAQARGIATLPGGVPIFRDTPGQDGVRDGVGDTLIGGIGVFFPGSDGFATHEQGFVPGIGQTQEQRLNADRVLEAEFIALAAVGGSATAEAIGIEGADVGAINGVAEVPNLDLPFGRLDLVGIQLPVFGPIAGRLGLEILLEKGQTLGVGDPESGADQPVLPGMLYRNGEAVPVGWLVEPHDSKVDNLTAEDVRGIIERGIQGADCVRAAIRLPVGSRTRMVFAVTDTSGEVLGLYRMQDATFFSIDVAVAKARNTAYYADPTALQPFDQVLPEDGVAFTNRTFRFLAEPRYPAGIDDTVPGPFSILLQPGISAATAENIGGPVAAGNFDPAVDFDAATVLGFDAFFPNTNFQDPADVRNQNGIVFFPGSTPIYKDDDLIGGLGVSGDGVDQDDVVTFIASQGFLPSDDQIVTADETFVRDVRLPYFKFLRNPFG